MTAIVSYLIGKAHTGKTAVTGFMPRILGGRFLMMLQCATLFLLVISARFWLIGKYGSDLPYWDQWDAEGDGLYKRAFDGTLTFRDWFAPHNEHRIFFTRLSSYALKTINGQWDARVQMVVNSSFYALVACGLFLLFARGRSYLFGLFWSIVLSAIFSCPFGWENTLAGFQSQFYFMTAFSLSAIWLMLNKPNWSWGWTTGIVLGFCSLFTMASGFLAPLAILCFICLTLSSDWRSWRKLVRHYWPTSFFCLLMLCAGIILITKVERHVGYKAQGVVEFVNSLLSCMAWPWMHQKWWAIVCWLPAILLVSSYLIRRSKDDQEMRFLATLVAWCLLQEGATAFSRSTIINSSRYSDTFSIAVVVNILCLCLLLRNRIRSAQGLVLLPLMILYLTVNGLGIYRLGFNGATQSRKATYDIEKYRTAGFVATGNMGFLTDTRRKTDIPYPVPKTLASLLRDPALDPILAVSVRKPLAVNGNSTSPVYLSFEDYKLESISPYPWEKLWPFSISESQSGYTNYSVSKTIGLPFLHLYVFGNADNLMVTDSQNSQHRLVNISGIKGDFQEVYVYCPSMKCQIGATGNKERILFSEPKEMGALSLAAVLLTENWNIFLFLGIFGFFCFCSLCLLKVSSDWSMSNRMVNLQTRIGDDQLYE